MQEAIYNEIIEVLKTLGLPTGLPFVVEHPGDMAHGDYATNVAMVYAKEAAKNPRELAGVITEALVNREASHIAAYEIAGPGFINIRLAPHYFAEEAARIQKDGDEYGKVSVHAGKKILVEHSSPNLFKPFHIGHMMNNAIGESMVRLMRYSGAEVVTMTFPSDISLGVAKAIAVALEHYPESAEQEWEMFLSNSDYRGSIKRAIMDFGVWYVIGTEKFENDLGFQENVKEIANKLYSKQPSYEYKIFEDSKILNIKYFEEITAKLGSHFDSYIFESEAGVVGKEIVLQNTPQVFTESEGAIVYIPEEEKKHIHTAVFINSQGNPTYEAKDLGLLSMKFDRVHPDLSIFVTDHQQIQHFDVVLDAAEKIHSAWKEKSVHIPHGRMTFKGQKMSSRLGGVPLASDIIDVVKEEATERAGEKANPETVEMVAIAALKFAILRAKPGQNINFDPETSLSFEGDSGPYLQYTHARLNSLLEKAAAEGLHPSAHPVFSDVYDVHKLLHRFPEIVRDAIAQYAPHTVAVYLLELARAFNSYYGGNKIIDTEDKEGTESRLALVTAAKTVIKNGLFVLGIQAPEKM